MGLSTVAHERMVGLLPHGGTAAVDDAVLVRQVQGLLGLKADGIAGPRTLARLWLDAPMDAGRVIVRARSALQWPAVRYSMSENTGLGESWLSDMDAATKTGDCSDFVCHCLGLPKDQTHGLASPLIRGAVWLGADAIAGGAVGPGLPLAEARPGDIIVYAGRWERGERVAVGHVEVCVEVIGDRVWTVGCASSNKPSAIQRADKTSLWRRKGAVAVRPRWYV